MADRYCGKNKNVNIDHMSTEELIQILQMDDDLQAQAGLDEDVILRIGEVVSRREMQEGSIPYPNIDKAWDTFLTQYAPCGGSLLDDLAEDEPKRQEEMPTRKTRSSHRRILRAAGIAAVLAALLLATTLTAQALGFDLWKAIAGWTRETFTFTAEGYDDQDPTQYMAPEAENVALEEDPCSELRAVLTSYGIKERIVPTWIPEGFVLDPAGVDVIDTIAFTAFSVYYTSGEEIFSISILYHKSPPQQYAQWEKDDGDPVLYKKGGIDHYLMTNAGRQRAVWFSDQCECGILGDITHDELLAVVDSIYERGR